MIKKSLNYKLVNLTLLAIIIFLFYQTKSFWVVAIDKISAIILPLLFGFAIAYALHPLLKFLQKLKIPKGIAILIIIILVFTLIGTIIGLVIPLLARQIVNLVDSLLVFINNISINPVIKDNLLVIFDEIVENMSDYVPNGAIKTISTSVNIIMTSFVVIVFSIYLLIDMDRIREWIKSKSSTKFYYLQSIDKEIKNYLKAICKISFISFFEYGIGYLIIGHPNALLLAILASIANFIPHFGGVFISSIAWITAFVISPQLFIKAMIMTLVCSLIDNYVIDPYIYGKSNKLHPLVIILGIFIGGILFGFMGMIMALPISIIILATYRFYSNEIKDQIRKVKENVRSY